MPGESAGGALSRDEIRRMVGLVDPDWTVRDATPVIDGVSPVYRVVVDGSDGSREVFLKAARGDDHPAAGDPSAEARLVAAVGERTTIPLPSIRGVVDDHATLRTPFFVMESLEGCKRSPGAIGSLSEATVRRAARRTGRWLGELHGIDFENVTTFGRGIRAARSPAMRGEAPSGDPAELVHRDGYDDFRAQLRDWWDEDFTDRAGAPRFDGLGPEIHATLRERLASIPASFAPTVARLDHGWHNLLVDDAGEITGVLDWGTLAAFPPAYDIALVELRLAGGPRIALPEVPDRRGLVRESLLRGYRERRPLPDAFGVQRECYQLDVLQSWLAGVDGGPTAPGVPADRSEKVAAGLRSLIEATLN